MENKDLPKISIMIPTYNQELYIDEAIKSALAQDYDNLEVVVSDDCSTDNTELVVQKYLSDARVKYFKNEKNLGRVGNYRKTLYDYATGEWVVNLDGDDYYIDSHFVSYIAELISKYKSEDIVVLWISEPGYDKSVKVFKDCIVEKDVLLLNGIRYFQKYPKVGIFAHYNFIYNRNLALKTDFYSFNSLNSDFHSGIRLILRGNMLLINRSVAYWRMHENNASLTDYSTKLTQSIDALKSIYLDAQSFLSPKDAKSWFLKMERLEKQSFTVSIACQEEGLTSFLFVLFHPVFTKTYLILSVKMLIRTLGIKSKYAIPNRMHKTKELK